MSNKILCFGEVLWDNLPSGARPGGAPMNVALHLKRFGIGSRVASAIGKDWLGESLASFLEKSGLDTSLIQVHPTLPTSEVKVHLNEHNNATFEICEPVAWDEITLTGALLEEVKSSNAIVYGSLASRNKTTRDTLLELLESDVVKIMDVNLRPPYNKREIIEPLLMKADIVKLNDEELFIISNWFGLTGTLEELAFGFYDKLNLKTLLVTRGDKGACLIHENELYAHQGFKVEVADTVGAGDAFLAGFLAAFYDGKGMNMALTEASAIGAYVASQSGATPEYTIEVLQPFLSPAI
ncbi:MAG: carbohydrate kinase [Bacteroidetes bacterium]|nr:carbohydrate kinase [Bacteroidota bacterium]